MPHKDPEARKAYKAKWWAKQDKQKQNERKLKAYHAQTEEQRKAFREMQKASKKKKPEKYLELSRKAYSKRNKNKTAEVQRSRYFERGGKEKATTYRRANPQIFALSAVRRRCKIYGIPYDLTADWYRETYTGKCSLTGLSFAPPPEGRRWHAFTASIDRIEPSKGYVVGNCRWVLMALNAMRGADGDEVMFQIARALVRQTDDGGIS